MAQTFTIAQARHHLAALVHDLERQPYIQLTRRGKPVAVLLSMQAFERLSSGQSGFWDAFTAFCETVDLQSLQLDPNPFGQVRDRSTGREVSW